MTPLLEHTIRTYVAGSHGWTTPDRCVQMAQLILDNPVEIAVEIGVFGGRSFISQALAMKEKGAGRIYGIDPWKIEPALEGENSANREYWSKMNFASVYQPVIDSIWKYSLDQYAVTIRACSQHCSELFNSIDVLYLDGNHSEIASCRDVQLYVPKLSNGAFMWMDDCDWPTTQKAQQMIECMGCKVVEDNFKYKLYRKC